MPETGFHFDQPLWFLGLLLIPLVALWLKHSRAQAARAPIHRYADPHLLPYLTGTRDLNTAERWGRFWRWSLLWTLGLIAMAGPRWDYRELRLFHPGNHLLILIDISRSMLVEDTSPNRLARARQEIQDLILYNREVRLGLLAFATVPHVLTPITEDMSGLLSVLPALSSELVSPNLQGSSLTRALMRAESLLAGLPKEGARSLLLISDGDFAEPNLREQVARLAEQGVRLHVLGIGTPEGGTIPAPQGGIILDPNDPQRRPVRSALNESLLQELAQAGGGIYRRADFRQSDTQAILKAAAANRLPPEASDVRTRVWNERYWLALIPLAILMLMQLRETAAPRGLSWRPGQNTSAAKRASSVQPKVLLAVILLIPLPSQADWFKTREQQGYALYERGEYSAAARLFSDPYRRGVALYRFGDYQGAERAFDQALTGPFAEDARYNLGNARFKLGDYAGAAEAYEGVLAQNPAHEDAAYNLALVRAMLARLEQEQFQQETKQQQPEKERQAQGKEEGATRSAEQQRSQRRPQETDTLDQAAEQQQAQEQTQRQTEPQGVQQQTQQSQSSQQSSQSQQGQQQQSAQTQQGQQQSGQGQQAHQSAGQQQGAQQQAGDSQQQRSPNHVTPVKSRAGQGQGDQSGGQRGSGQIIDQGTWGGSNQDRQGRTRPGETEQGATEPKGSEAQDQRGAGEPQAEGTGGSGSPDKQTREDRARPQQPSEHPEQGPDEQRDEGAQTEALIGQGGSDREGLSAGEHGGRDSPEQRATGQHTDNTGRSARDQGPQEVRGDMAQEQAQVTPLKTGANAQGQARDPGHIDGQALPPETRHPGAGRDPEKTFQEVPTPLDSVSDYAGMTRRNDEKGAGMTPNPHPSENLGRRDRARPAQLQGLHPESAGSIERFDQLGQGLGEDETYKGMGPAFWGVQLIQGPGMAILEERLERIQGDPSLLIRNQFRLEEQRLTPGATGQWVETRPW